MSGGAMISLASDLLVLGGQSSTRTRMIGLSFLYAIKRIRPERFRISAARRERILRKRHEISTKAIERDILQNAWDLRLFCEADQASWHTVKSAWWWTLNNTMLKNISDRGGKARKKPLSILRRTLMLKILPNTAKFISMANGSEQCLKTLGLSEANCLRKIQKLNP